MCKEGDREGGNGGMKSLGVVGQVNCGWLGGWKGLNRDGGDAGRGLQVVFAKLKGQHLESIC